MTAVQVDVGSDKYALVDLQDVVFLEGRVWKAYQLSKGCWYVQGNGGTYLHRFLLSAPDGVEVDHKNGDGLDNRRDNLRQAAHQQNLFNQQLSRANTSGFKGVSRSKNPDVWAARIKHNGVSISLGFFSSRETAAYAYDLAALDLFGSFARFNLLRLDEEDLTALRDRVAGEKRILGAALRGVSTPHPHAAVLNEQKVREIRRLFAAEGVTIAQLARQFNVHRMTVKPILIRKTWKHVD